MKIAAVIGEYNPFHHGHAYLAEEIRRRSSPDFLITVMSGDFVQRGEPAVFDKYYRTRSALEAGFDAVLELPVRFATGSAEYFARGAVALLDALDCVDELWFGSEAGEIQAFQELASVLADEPPAYRGLLKERLKKGEAFPAARSRALGKYLQKEQNTAFISLLSRPNNIMALEYCIALRRQKSRIIPHTIPRLEAEQEGRPYRSASSIRKLLSGAVRSEADSRTSDRLSEVMKALPPMEAIRMQGHLEHSLPVFPEDFDEMLFLRLLEEDVHSLCTYRDIGEDLAYRIIHKRERFTSWRDFCRLLKTKNRTWTTISRALLSILLGLKKAPEVPEVPYLRILGFRKAKSGSVLSVLSAHAKQPLAVGARLQQNLSTGKKKQQEAETSTKVQRNLSVDTEAFHKDFFASSLYEAVRARKSHQRVRNEFQRGAVIFKR